MATCASPDSPAASDLFWACEQGMAMEIVASTVIAIHCVFIALSSIADLGGGAFRYAFVVLPVPE
jgi:hypothetical protein